MTRVNLSRYAGWSAFVSAIATILGFVTLIVFFAVGQPWGTFNDIASVVLALSLMVVLLALHHWHRRRAPVIRLTILIMGLLSLLMVAVFQTLLIVGAITFEQTAITVLVAWGMFGATLMIYNVNSLLPRRLTWLGVSAGAGYVSVIVGFLLGGQEHPLSAIGGLTSVVCYPPWAIWFGRIILREGVSW